MWVRDSYCFTDKNATFKWVEQPGSDMVEVYEYNWEDRYKRVGEWSFVGKVLVKENLNSTPKDHCFWVHKIFSREALRDRWWGVFYESYRYEFPVTKWCRVKVDAK